MSWASAVSHSAAPRTNAEGGGSKASSAEVEQSEITKIKQMLEIVISENKALKAEIAKLKGANCNLLATPQNSGASHRSLAAAGIIQDQSPKTLVEKEPSQIPLLETSSSDAMDESTPQSPESPPPKRRATNKEEGLSRNLDVSGASEWGNQEMINQFGESLSGTLSKKFEAMLAKFAESIGAKIDALNTRVTLLETATPRLSVGGGGGAGPIKPTKPYSRPTSVESARATFENAQQRNYGAE